MRRVDTALTFCITQEYEKTIPYALPIFSASSADVMQILVVCGGSDGPLVMHTNGMDTIAALKRSVTQERPWLPCNDMVPISTPSLVARIWTVCEIFEHFNDLFQSAQRVIFGGRNCADGWTLKQAGVRSGSLVQLLYRLRGGGGDGGATGAESRSSYLEMYMGKKPEKVTFSPPSTHTLHHCTRTCTAPWPYFERLHSFDIIS